MKPIIIITLSLLLLSSMATAGSNELWDYLLVKGLVAVDDMKQCSVTTANCPDIDLQSKICQMYNPQKGCNHCRFKGVDESCHAVKEERSLFADEYKVKKPSSDYNEIVVTNSLTGKQYGSITKVNGDVYACNIAGECHEAKDGELVSIGFSNIIIAKENSSAVLNLIMPFGINKLPEKTIYYIKVVEPSEEERNKSRGMRTGFPNQLDLFLGRMWSFFKKWTYEEEWDINPRTAAIGVRG